MIENPEIYVDFAEKIICEKKTNTKPENSKDPVHLE